MEATKKRRLLIGLTVYATVLLLMVMVTNITPFNQWFMQILRLLRPVLIGLVLAYLLNSFFRFYERKLLYKVKPHGLRRVLSLVLTYLSLLLIIAALVLLIIPQLVNTIVDFMDNSAAFAETALYDLNLIIDWINGILPTKSDGSGFLAPANPVHIKRTVEEFLRSLMLDGKLLEGSVRSRLDKLRSDITGITI
jgi:predicted PurR-regulated permease PerM